MEQIRLIQNNFPELVEDSRHSHCAVGLLHTMSFNSHVIRSTMRVNIHLTITQYRRIKNLSY